MRKIFRYLLPVSLLLSILGYLNYKLDLSSLLEKLSWKFLIFGLFLELAFYFIESVRIWFLSGRAWTLLTLWKTRLASVFIGIFLPGAISSDGVRVMMLSSGGEVSPWRTLLILLLNRLYGVFALVVILFLSIRLKPTALNNIDLEWSPLFYFVGGAFVISPLLFKLRLFRRLLLSFRPLLRGKIRHLYGVSYLALSQFSSARNWSIALTSSMVTNLIVVSQFACLGYALGSSLEFPQWIVCVSVVSLASFVPLGFGAFGSQDLSLVGIGLAFGQKPENLLLISLLIHFFRILGAFLGILYIQETTSRMVKWTRNFQLPQIIRKLQERGINS